MQSRYRLGGLGNDELLAALSGLVQRENDLMSDLLAHLAELDERRLYLELGFSSLFAYCTGALGFCKSAAGRRIAVARVCRRYPEAFARVARGELQLSLLAQHLNSENATELFDACSRKGCEQVEELLAARFPKPDVRDSIRRLPARVEVAPDGGCAGDATQLAGTSVQSKSSRVAGSATPAPSPAPVPSRTMQPMPAQRKLEPLAPDRFGVHFTADAEFRELLEEVRALASHRELDGNLLRLMKRGLEAYRRELQKQRFGVGRKPRRVRREAVGESKSHTRSRHVPAAVSREVYLRDDGRCTFCSKDGRRCGARRFLQLDHVTPWAVEGQSSVENLRLRCRAHNLHAARLYFGAGFIRKKQGRAPATESAAALSLASRESVQRKASCALRASPED
jgi:5-methylcytosine-specific restriction endonuclease McrA